MSLAYEILDAHCRIKRYEHHEKMAIYHIYLSLKNGLNYNEIQRGSMTESDFKKHYSDAIHCKTLIESE